MHNCSKYGDGKIFKISMLCSPRMYLFDQYRIDIVKLFDFKNIIYSSDVKPNLHHPYSSIQHHMIFRIIIQSNMLIRYPRNISDYYQC